MAKAKFCANCGTEIKGDAQVCLNCGSLVGGEKKMAKNKFCSNCGAEIKEDAQVCLSCGTLVSPAKKVSDPNAKSKLCAGLLGIFLGTFGVHNFYLGYTGKAVAQLLITILSCFWLCWVSAIWGLIEGIIILTSEEATDAKGNPLKD